MAQQLINVSSPNDGLGDPLRTAMIKVNTMFTELYDTVVFQEDGKGLSSNDFTDELSTKLEGIEEGAEVNVQADMAQEDDTQDDFVKNKDSFIIARKLPQIESYSGTNTFTVPADYAVSSVVLVRTLLWDNEEWTQTGDQLTITKTMNTGNRIQINFY